MSQNSKPSTTEILDWTPGATVQFCETFVIPSGSIVKSNSAAPRTTGANYDATEAAFWDLVHLGPTLTTYPGAGVYLYAGQTLFYSCSAFAWEVSGLTPAAFDAANWDKLMGPNSISNHYYVTPFGNDLQNDGHSSECPFETIEKAASVAVAGDTIFLQAGQTHEGQGVLADGVIVDAYDYIKGSSQMPKISTLSDLDSATISAEGTANVYQVSLPALAGFADIPSTFNTIAPTPWLYEDDAPLQWQASIADVSANPGSFYFAGSSSAITTAAITVFFHPKDSSDATTNGKKYRGTRRLYALCSEGAVTVKNTAFLDVSCEAGATFYRGNSLADSCLYLNCTKHHARIDGTGEFRDCVFFGEVPPNDQFWGGGRNHAVIFGDALQTYTTATFTDCVFVDSTGIAAYSHVISVPGAQDYSEVAFNGCYAWRVNTAYSCDQTALTTVSNCYVEDYKTAVFTFRNAVNINTLTALNHKDLAGVFVGGESGTQGALTASNLAIAGENSFGESAITSGGPIDVSQSSYYNTSDDSNGSTFLLSITNTPDVRSGSLALQNSVVYAAAYPYRDYLGVPAIDNNLYYGERSSGGSANANFYFANGVFYSSIVDVTIAHPTVDPNSVERTDPLWETDPVSGDFSLGELSPALQAGRDWGARSWVVPPEKRLLELQWNKCIYAHPNDVVGTSYVIER